MSATRITMMYVHLHTKLASQPELDPSLPELQVTEEKPVYRGHFAQSRPDFQTALNESANPVVYSSEHMAACLGCTCDM